VYTDVLGLTQGYIPGFVQQFADAGTVFEKGLGDFARAVRERNYP